MLQKEVIFGAVESMTPRMAATISEHAEKYDAEIRLEMGEKRMRVDSLIGILSLELRKGVNVTVIADGPQEKEAVEDLSCLLRGE